jgi:hypothetical protein
MVRFSKKTKIGDDAFKGTKMEKKANRRKRVTKVLIRVAVGAAIIATLFIINNFVEQSRIAKERAALERAIAEQNARPKDGTYTFEPRLRTQKGNRGGYIDQWLAKIVAHGGNIDLYLTSKPEGKGARELKFGPPSTLMLINTGTGNYAATEAPVWDEGTGAYIVTFQNVTSRQFWYSETNPDPDLFIADIKLDNPDE